VNSPCRNRRIVIASLLFVETGRLSLLRALTGQVVVDLFPCMSIPVGAACGAGMIVATSIIASARPVEGSGYGAYLADRFGSTCASFLAAADATDRVRLQPYADTINRLVAQKWGSVTTERLHRVVLAIVTECGAQVRSEFESTARNVIARSNP
jgi:hypothetical protein